MTKNIREVHYIINEVLEWTGGSMMKIFSMIKNKRGLEGNS